MCPYVMQLPRTFLDGMWNRWWMFPSQCLWFWISSSNTERAQQRSVEQVVHAHAPPATVSERNVELAVDVPVPCVAPGFARVLQHETPPTRAAAAWLDAPQEQFDGFFRTFSPGRNKSPRSQVRLCKPHSSPSTAISSGQPFHGR